jgi:hypothetical protein
VISDDTRATVTQCQCGAAIKLPGNGIVGNGLVEKIMIEELEEICFKVVTLRQFLPNRLRESGGNRI